MKRVHFLLRWPPFVRLPMPELPEVETIRRTLTPLLKGCTLQKVQVLSPSLRLPLDRDAFAELVGKALTGLKRRGKILLFEFGDKGMLCHLGMSGSLLLQFDNKPQPRHTHVIFDFSGNVSLMYVDPRRFGVLLVMEKLALASHQRLVKLGPEPFDFAAVTASLLQQRACSRRMVRDVLLDQEVVAGLGNIYACEALFAAKIKPYRRISTLSRKKTVALANALAEVLSRALEAGGTTLRDKGFRNALGEEGYFGVELAVYGKTGQPCPVCNKPIVRKTLSGRSAFYCINCQR